MNRIIQFLPSGECRHCVAERQYQELKARAEALEEEGDGAFEFCVPSARRLAGEEIDPEEVASDPPTVTLYVALEAERVPVDADLRTYAVEELLSIADELIAAANRLMKGRMEGTVPR
jgi:hypothetical protein